MTWIGIPTSGLFLTANQGGGVASIDFEEAAGDVSGVIDSLVVTGLRRKPISTQAPASGDTLVFDGTQWNPETIDSVGGSGVGPHSLLSTTHTDTLPESPVIGDFIIGSGAPAKWVRFPIGAPNQSLVNISGIIQWAHNVPYIHTSGAILTLNEYNRKVVVNKTVGAPTLVNLPSSPYIGQEILIKDGKGDSSTNNITVAPPSGSFIDSFSQVVIRTNWQSIDFLFNGTQWNLI